MATVYQCMHRGTHPQTSACHEFNQGNRPKCKGCKSTIRAIAGHAIVAPWRGDNRYTLDQAVKEYASFSAAEKAAMQAYDADNSSELVARFILA